MAVQLATAGFSIYLERFADFDEVYGPLGAVFALLLLVYVVSAILLFGACLAAARRAAAVGAVPAGGQQPLRTRILRALRALVARDRS